MVGNQDRNFSERLRRARTTAGLTQRALAQQLEVHPLSVGRWERGTQIPDGTVLAGLASILGVSADFLLGLEEERTPVEHLGGLSTEEEALIKSWRRLDRRGQNLVREMIHWEQKVVEEPED